MRPIPADFAETRSRLRNPNVLAQHYKVSHRTIRRWVAVNLVIGVAIIVLTLLMN